MLRLFVGLSIPETVAERLAALADGTPGVRWIDPDNMHITLRFIGEVDEATAMDLDEALAEIRRPPLSITLSGIDHFSSSRETRSIWAGVQRADALAELKGAVDRAAREAEAGGDGRRFKPHVTIGRCRGVPPHRIGAFLERANPFTAGPFDVGEFVLFSSHLGKGGADYQVAAAYPLDG